MQCIFIGIANSKNLRLNCNNVQTVISHTAGPSFGAARPTLRHPEFITLYAVTPRLRLITNNHSNVTLTCTMFYDINPWEQVTVVCLRNMHWNGHIIRKALAARPPQLILWPIQIQIQVNRKSGVKGLFPSPLAMHKAEHWRHNPESMNTARC